MKILIIEDDKIKLEKVSKFLKKHSVVHRESFQSGMQEIKINFKSYDFLILDMSIPMWDIGNNDLGGNHEQFGGEKIMREMKRKNKTIPTVLFTMFDVFPIRENNLTFNQIKNSFKDEFTAFFVGAVFYNSDNDNWQVELSELLAQ